MYPSVLALAFGFSSGLPLDLGLSVPLSEAIGVVAVAVVISLLGRRTRPGRHEYVEHG